MKFRLIHIILLSCLTANAFAIGEYSFEENTIVPSAWTCHAGGNLSIGTDHFTDGNQGLKWTFSPQSKLIVDMGGTNNAPIVYLPVYSSIENQDTLQIRLLTADRQTILRQSSMLLNFKGWREFHRHFMNDFGKNPAEGKFRFVEIIYKPSQHSKRTAVWFDGVKLAAPENGLYEKRYPGPFMKPDYEKGYFNNIPNVNTECIDAFLSPIPEVTITPEHRSAFADIQKHFSYTALGGETKTDAKSIAAAKDSVRSYQIGFNPDGTVKGKAIGRDKFTNAAALQAFSKTILNLSIAAQGSSPDKAAADSLIKFTLFLLDRGLAEGGATFLPTNNYDFCRKYLWMGWTHAMPVYQAYDKEHLGSTVAKDVLRWLKWVYYYGSIYRKDINDVPGDYINVASRFLFCFANFNATADEQIRDYICGVRFYEKFTEAKQNGWSSGIKPDGSYFHHGSIHNSYSQCMGQWVNDMKKMKNSAFAIGKEAYFNISKGILTELLESATKDKNAYFANTLTGRGPMKLDARVTLTNFEDLIYMGGYAIGQAFEPTMAAAYNYLSKTNTFKVESANLDGFHQRNYGSMGLYRSQKGWVATMRGMTSRLWGAEIYNKANRFGRYMSHGALEIMYNDAENMPLTSGYPTEQSWDWNVVPGTTVVRHFPDYWQAIQPTLNEDRADEFQKKDFVGALTKGKNGVFAMDFEESSAGWHNRSRYQVTDKLAFKKSVFAYKDLLICLGSNIRFSPEAGRTADTLATNLFQFVQSGVEKRPYFLNNADENTADIHSKIILKNNNWLVSPAGTGFFVPKQNGVLNLFCGTQNTPPHTVASNASEKDYENALITTDAVKAWISHTNNSSYEMVVIPKTTPKELKSLSLKLGNGKGIYEVLRQDSLAHIVKFNEENLTAYALFDKATALPGLLESVDAACLVMIQPEGKAYHLSVCSPDLNCQDDPICKWIAAPKKVTLIVNATWTASSPLPENVSVNHLQNRTIIMVVLKDGLDTQLYFN